MIVAFLYRRARAGLDGLMVVAVAVVRLIEAILNQQSRLTTNALFRAQCIDIAVHFVSVSHE